MINQLDGATVRALLIDLTTRGSPSAQAAVQQAYHKFSQVPPIDFNQQSKEVGLEGLEQQPLHQNEQ